MILFIMVYLNFKFQFIAQSGCRGDHWSSGILQHKMLCHRHKLIISFRKIRKMFHFSADGQCPPLQCKRNDKSQFTLPKNF